MITKNYNYLPKQKNCDDCLQQMYLVRYGKQPDQQATQQDFLQPGQKSIMGNCSR